MLAWDAAPWWHREIYVRGELQLMRMQADKIAASMMGDRPATDSDQQLDPARGASSPVDTIESRHEATLDNLERSGFNVVRQGR